MTLGIRERLRLLMAFGAGSCAAEELAAYADGADGFERLMRDERFAENELVRRLRGVSAQQLDGVLECCAANGITLVTPEGGDYPERLRRIDDPPQLLFVLGDIGAVNRCHTAAVVGSRRAGNYSKSVTSWFVHEIAAKSGSRPANIISGFARGIDRAAHLSALDAGAYTTAVLGCGLLFDYPTDSSEIKARIAAHGAVVSEYLPYASPDRESFRVRNRLISGMSDCVLAVQAGRTSGALNTASHAAEQGREVFVIPPADLFSPDYAGQTQLLAEGASLALTPSDIIGCFNDLDELYNLQGKF